MTSDDSRSGVIGEDSEIAGWVEGLAWSSVGISVGVNIEVPSVDARVWVNSRSNSNSCSGKRLGFNNGALSNQRVLYASMLKSHCKRMVQWGKITI